jgi:mRNA interferase MazF
MKEGDVVLIAMTQSNGQTKKRPAIVLRSMPPFGDLLVCGVSTQLHQQVAGFDDTIEPSHPDFAASGVKSTSLIRLGFLAVLPASSLSGKIGQIDPKRHRRLLERLASYLSAKPQP